MKGTLTGFGSLPGKGRGPELGGARGRLDPIHHQASEEGDRRLAAASLSRGRYHRHWTVLGGELAVPCTRNPL